MSPIFLYIEINTIITTKNQLLFDKQTKPNPHVHFKKLIETSFVSNSFKSSSNLISKMVCELIGHEFLNGLVGFC